MGKRREKVLRILNSIALLNRKIMGGVIAYGSQNLLRRKGKREKHYRRGSGGKDHRGLGGLDFSGENVQKEFKFLIARMRGEEGRKKVFAVKKKGNLFTERRTSSTHSRRGELDSRRKRKDTVLPRREVTSISPGTPPNTFAAATRQGGGQNERGERGLPVSQKKIHIKPGGK